MVLHTPKASQTDAINVCPDLQGSLPGPVKLRSSVSFISQSFLAILSALSPQDRIIQPLIIFTSLFFSIPTLNKPMDQFLTDSCPCQKSHNDNTGWKLYFTVCLLHNPCTAPGILALLSHRGIPLFQNHWLLIPKWILSPSACSFLNKLILGFTISSSQCNILKGESSADITDWYIHCLLETADLVVSESVH